ncbi:hypothetical protein Tco_1451589, partial [Tanacetum coccineum]
TKTALCACCECINTKQILALGLEYCPLKVISTFDRIEGFWIATVDKDHVGGGVYESEGFGWTWGGQRGLKVTGGGVMSLAGKWWERCTVFQKQLWVCGFVTNGPPWL